MNNATSAFQLYLGQVWILTYVLCSDANLRIYMSLTTIFITYTFDPLSIRFDTSLPLSFLEDFWAPIITMTVPTNSNHSSNLKNYVAKYWYTTKKQEHF